jgi:uncharacterized peroxidase-related enzyme
MDIFSKIENERGMVARIYSDFSAFPESVAAHFELNKVLMLSDSSPLPRFEREFLACETSMYNGNDYCATHHKEAYEKLKQASVKSQDRMDHLAKLSYVLTNTPSKASYLKPLFLSTGFTEAEWQHAVNIVSYFNYTNRLAFAMGMELEPGYEKSCN